MLKKPETGWAIVDGAYGGLWLVDGRMHIYWKRNVAVAVARENGWKHEGREKVVRICKVTVKQA